MRLGLENKVALVTGGNSGIGRATAIAFAEEGAKVVVSARNVARGEETVRVIRQVGGDAIFVKADVSKEEDVKALVQKTIDTYGRLDCAFNNAGITGGPKDLTVYLEADWNQTIDINLKGIWLCMKYEIPHMLALGGGAIVNMSSSAGLRPVPKLAIYGASKHGILGLTKNASMDFAAQGIRVNALCPGVIDTPMMRESIKDPEMLELSKKLIPLGRYGTSEDVAKAAVWLCSDAASYITGVSLSIDGGFAQH